MTIDVGVTRRYGNDLASGAEPFRDSDGTATDPTSALLSVKKPDGTTIEYAWDTPAGEQEPLIRESAGRFYADVVHDQPGLWSFRLAGLGAVSAAAEMSAFVRRSAFPSPS